MRHTTASPLFVGRAREMGRLRDGLDRAEAGQGSTILVQGDAGVGKSRLVQEFCEEAKRRDVRVLLGGCLRIGGDALPLTAVSEALRGLVDDLGADGLRKVAGEATRSLAPLVPALGPPRRASGPSASEGDDARVQLFGAVLQLLTQLGRAHPTVLVLEDVHWADEATRDLLVFLAHNILRHRVLVLATHRRADLEPGHGLRPVVTELLRADGVEQVELAPFDRDELAVHLEALLARPPRRDVLDRVFERSQGNPFFIEELVATGVVEHDAPLPMSLRETLLASLETLPAPSRGVLRVVAAAGRRIHHELLAAVAQLPDDELDDALRPALNRRILVTEEDRGTYAFRHALFSEAIASTLLLGERRRLHRRLAEALEADRSLAAESPAGELAVHWHAAGDDARTLEVSVEAAREAEALHAITEARRHVERVLATWGQVECPQDLVGLERPHVVAWLAELALLSGDADAAAELLAEAIEGDVDEPGLLGLWHLRRADALEAGGDDEAAARARELAGVLVPAEPPTLARVRLLSDQAAVLWESDPGRGVELGRGAVAMARELGDAPAEARALTALASSLAHVGRLDEAVEAFRAARGLADGIDPVQVARSHLSLSAVLIRGGRAAEGAEEAMAGLSFTRAHGIDGLYGPWLAANATSGWFWCGRWDDAADLVTEIAGGAALDDFLVLLQVRLLAHRGDVAAARALLGTPAGAMAARDPRYVAVRLAVACLGSDRDLDEAHRIVLERASHAPPRHAATANERAAWALRVEADRGDADPDLSSRILAETTLERSAGVAHAEPWRLTAIAEHARCTGADDPAPWRAALAAWQGLEWPHQVAYARFRLAEALLARSEQADEVTELLCAAHEVADDLSATPLRDDLVALGRRAGIDLRRRADGPDAPPGGLTPREHEVLGLVAAGHSNRVIGELLFISQKTASVHVSNILRKLEVQSRTEAAAVAVRSGLLGSEGASSPE